MSSSDKRLFVALSLAPYEWFRTGKKRWELRRCRSQFTSRHVRTGRRVELRAGYGRSRPSLWGTITEVRLASSLAEFFELVPFRSVIPPAQSLNEAMTQASGILRIEADAIIQLIGFQVDLDG